MQYQRKVLSCIRERIERYEKIQMFWMKLVLCGIVAIAGALEHGDATGMYLYAWVAGIATLVSTVSVAVYGYKIDEAKEWYLEIKKCA